MVPSFHPDLVLGVATYARELLVGAPTLDTVYVPIGLGSGICGMILVRDLLGLPTEIVGVVSDRAPTYRLSFEAGAPVPTDTADTFVDGVACRVPDPVAVDIICQGAARVIEVPDEATADAMRILHRTTHNTAEPAGAIALAGAISERQHIAGRRVAVVVTGGNVDADVLASILQRQPPTRHRHRVSVAARDELGGAPSRFRDATPPSPSSTRAQPFFRLPSGLTTNQTSPEPWPLVWPGSSSPANRYSGHLPALSWCDPSSRSTMLNTAGSSPSGNVSPSTSNGGHASAQASLHVG